METKKIVIVDDDKCITELLRDSLPNMFPEVEFSIFNDPQEFIIFFENNHREISLIILDYNLPHTEISLFVKKIISIEPYIKIIMCTGYDEEAVYKKFPIELFGVITKPFSFNNFVSVIKNGLPSIGNI